MLKNRYKFAAFLLLLVIMTASCGNAPQPVKADRDISFGTKEESSAETSRSVPQEAPSETSEAAAPVQPDTASSGMSAQKYLDTLKNIFHEYVGYNGDMSAALDSMDFDAAKRAAEEMDRVLSSFRDIDAPSDFADMHEKLCSSAETERKYNALCKRFTELCAKGDDLSESEKTELEEIVDSMQSFESDFGDVMLEVFKAVRETTE